MGREFNDNLFLGNDKQPVIPTLLFVVDANERTIKVTLGRLGGWVIYGERLRHPVVSLPRGEGSKLETTRQYGQHQENDGAVDCLQLFNCV